jgi:nitroreductase
MSTALDSRSLDQAFVAAHTANKFTDQPVSDDTLRALYDLCKWGPSSMNCQPMRLVFVRSAEAKARLKEALSPGNVDKTMAAPVTVIVGMDTQFFEHLPTQFAPMPAARDMFAGNATLAADTAMRNSSLQGGYLMVAARMLGLAAGPMSGFDPAKVNAAFFPDGRVKANFLVNLGYADASGNRPRGPRLAFEDVAQIA